MAQHANFRQQQQGNIFSDQQVYIQKYLLIIKEMMLKITKSKLTTSKNLEIL